MRFHGLRHAHAAKAPVDADRVLSDKGRVHARSRGPAFEGKGIKRALVTNVPRGHQTAEALLSAITGGGEATVIGVDQLYPVGKFPAMDAAFDRLGYASLRDYLKDPAAATELVEYAVRAWEAVVAETAGEDGDALLIGHAVCLPAIAYHVSREIRLGGDILDAILDANLGELEGFLIDPDGRTVTLITG